MRLVFMGTPDFAAASLRALLHAGHDVAGVFTQPDRPRGRGMKLVCPPVKELALSAGVPVHQPEKLRDGTALERLQTLAPEVIVVVAYGRILPKAILDFPPKGCINVHASLLPRLRGAAPIQWALLNGETETGVTTMFMDETLDTGDMLLRATVPVTLDDTAASLHDRLRDAGASLLIETLDALSNGTLSCTPQNHEEATFAPPLTKEMGRVDWARTAREIHNQIRALLGWPVAFTETDGMTLKLLSSRLTGETADAPPGRVLTRSDGVFVVCGDGFLLRLLEIQAPGSRRMPPEDYLRGHSLPETF